MKVKALAASIGMLCTSMAYAQTNITLYGVIDNGIHIANSGNGSQVNQASGIADGSRWGLKGVEDLGGGYKALFTLEGRFEADNGEITNTYLTDNVSATLTQGLTTLPPKLLNGIVGLLQPEKVVNPLSALFDRTAIVGLVTPGGAFIFGRQYTPGYEVAAMIDPFEAGTAAGWTNVAIGTGGIVTVGMAPRASDALQYRIELPNGLGASLMYAMSSTEDARRGTGTGALNYSKRFWGTNIKYQANNLNLGIGYNQETDPFGDKSLSTLVLGGSYALGNAKLFAGYMRMKNDNSELYDPAVQGLMGFGLSPARATTLAGQIAENTKVDANSYTLGMQYRMGANRFTVGISKTTNDLPGDAKATLYGIGYNYYLSKRTDLYAIAAHVDNENTAQYALGGAGYLGGFTTKPGQDSNAIQFGIRHKF